MSRLLDLTGQTFGRLFVVERADNSRRGAAMWLCRCECGEVKTNRGLDLRNGATRSCGCRSHQPTHGHSTNGGRSTEYRSWDHMRTRCSNPKSNVYHLYGARGIKVCERWQDSFEAFFADMGPKPTPNHSIDRINNDGNYEPGNCRWATAIEQANNKRPRKPQVAL